MSLYGALSIGVSGLSAFSQALSATSSNIANVNTVGYKEATANFSTFLNAESGVGNNSSAGVVSTTTQDITTQGLPTTTSSNTDMSISGSGFFVVATDPTATATQEYTRAGSFRPDQNGVLVNTAGLYLLGYKLDSAGNVPNNASNLTPISITGLSGTAGASTKMALQANLEASTTADGAYVAGQMASGVVAPDFNRTINVYDSQGGQQPVEMAFKKTAANTWAYEATYAGNAANVTSTTLSQGTITFNSDGTLANVNGAAPASGNIALTIPWAAPSGLTPQALTINLGTVGGTAGLTQYDAPSALNGQTVDGSAFGSVTGVTISTDGTVTAQFSNGLSQSVYKIPLATFTNPDGLGQISGNAYVATRNSGPANINLAKSGLTGAINSQSLEGSTVDLATEFTNLIVTQRAYSASARIVTTADQMLQQLEQLPTG
ncbi:MAG TPA: flagellar hook protein FlgE [Rhizomicrobium sp.]|jgi:flagellar hook protein FlgE|nr:flagellar hook protein FlgE [Rhizomicrobium sp.]